MIDLLSKMEEAGGFYEKARIYMINVKILARVYARFYDDDDDDDDKWYFMVLAKLDSSLLQKKS